MTGPFKMRSGNSPLFKTMGSSPLLDERKERLGLVKGIDEDDPAQEQIVPSKQKTPKPPVPKPPKKEEVKKTPKPPKA